MPLTLSRILRVLLKVVIAALILLFTSDFLAYQYVNSDYSISKDVTTSKPSLCVDCDGPVYCWEKHQQIYENSVRREMKGYQERAYECEWDLHYKRLGGMSYKELRAIREERRRAREECTIEDRKVKGGLGGEVYVGGEEAEVRAGDGEL